MGVEEESKKVEEVEAPPAAAAAAPVEAPKDVAEEKKVIPEAPTDDKVDDSKALAVVETWLNVVYYPPEYPHQSKEAPDSAEVKKSTSSVGSADRDAVLTRLATEKRMSLIKAWEEAEKSKAENKAHKKLSSISAWENSKKASVEAQLKRMEEKLEKKKAEYAEQMKNKIAIVHKEAEEKRAIVQAKHGEEALKAEELAAKYRATGLSPKKIFGCFGP
ncbi:hypothetical protein ACLOJK_024499 [Asimina triloba]